MIYIHKFNLHCHLTNISNTCHFLFTAFVCLHSILNRPFHIETKHLFRVVSDIKKITFLVVVVIKLWNIQKCIAFEQRTVFKKNDCFKPKLYITNQKVNATSCNGSIKQTSLLTYWKGIERKWVAEYALRIVMGGALECA